MVSDGPESPQPSAVPYQAYRSKRQSHSRNVSASRMTPSTSPPPPAATVPSFDTEKDAFAVPVPNSPPLTVPVVVLQPSPPASNGLPSPPESPSSADGPDPMAATPTEDIPELPATSSPTASSSSSPSTTTKPLPRLSNTRKASSFRHVPRVRPGIATSPLAPQSHSRTVSSSSASSLRHSMPPMESAPSFLSVQSAQSRVTSPSPLARTPLPSLAAPQPHHPATASLPVSPPTRTSSLQPSPAPSPVPPPQTVSPSISTHRPSRSATSTPPISRSPAPYRPGFQPKGVYRPRTDDFLSMRKQARDGVESAGRIERTKLERRLEKLIALHFPPEGSKELVRPAGNRRSSSFFDMDLNDLKRMSISDAGGLWKGVLTSGAGKNEIRVAEQRITPWEDDASVTKCPMCITSFHPLTNRKHHCRLCGKIVCSLPIKHPQRPVPCSILFVVDAKTRKIEEVGEGVDYGVKRKRTTSITGAAAREEETDKFLKGVRICRGCRPILLRQQYQQEMSVVPTFAHLYQVLLELEKEIEESLPQFQEMLVSLNQDDPPTKEAAVVRKRLLEVFAQYDGIAKRIRVLPCAPGGSQDRVQGAVVARAGAFLQRHMFPLQSLPKPKAKHKKSPSAPLPTGSSSSSTSIAPSSSSALDNPELGPDLDTDLSAEAAQALQPLLEQEALLESFVAEATAARKFEDAKILRANLGEIRGEIGRVVGEFGGSGGGKEGGGGKGKGGGKGQGRR